MKKIFIGVATILIPILAKTKSQFKEGLWEYRVKVDLTGVEMPELTFQHCARKEDYIPKTQAQANGECKETERKFDGKTATWQMECLVDGQKSRITGKATYFGNQMDAIMNMETPEGVLVQKIKGTYKGKCSR